MVFGCRVYPGDREPRLYEDSRIATGGGCNLSSFEMCAHNGTHVDAPYHFLNDGDTVDKIPLEKTVGLCFVVCHDGDIDWEAARRILCRARERSAEGAKRILVKGLGTLDADGAKLLAGEGIYLVGTESQSVGDATAPMEVHKILLGAGAVLLEGVCLDGVSEGEYFLCAAPLNLGGCDGAPCRALLIETSEQADN